MKCMYCDCMESKVIDTRPTDEGTVIRRRRECEGCGRRFTTYEKVEHVAILVVKRDGRRESFDSEKIRGGIIKACEKRPVSMDEIDAMVSDIEREVYNSLIKEISSARIGDLVMEKLRGKDDVAYVRFASVYKQFKDIDEFMDELRDLVKERSS
ncbi:transcriptional regulator NrdR [Christensenella sp. MSJ-20]|uniref:transcriptional regulator NrdR n=1 Tax=Christensenella sp. MSJ-20 TaxID=2841518 RepID=UPI001C73EC07|nr:transcriptional regulator NrdR [Christensenella sp. MSJ-20]